MSRRAPGYLIRRIGPLLVLGSIVSLADCRPRSVPPIDLLGALPSAERRAALPLETAIRVGFVDVDGDARPSLIMTAPARVTWRVNFPARPRLRAAVALLADSGSLGRPSVTARIGISGGRVYETLFALRLQSAPGASPTWRPVDIDLSAYSGWKWSLFYRPSEETWSLVFAADASPRGTIAWARPLVDMP